MWEKAVEKSVKSLWERKRRLQNKKKMYVTKVQKRHLQNKKKNVCSKNSHSLLAQKCILVRSARCL